MKNPYSDVDILIRTSPDTNIDYRSLKQCIELAKNMRDHFGMSYYVVRLPGRKTYTLTVNAPAASRLGYQLFYAAQLAGRRVMFDVKSLGPRED